MSQQHFDPTPTTALARPADAGGRQRAAGRARFAPRAGDGPEALFAARAARTPGATALVHGQQQVSYAELDAWTNRLARHLAGHGVRPGGLVAIHLERVPHLVGALLAVLRAGAGHVLLDPRSPTAELEAVLARTAPGTLITQTHLPPLATGAVTVDLTRDTAAVCALPAAPAARDRPAGPWIPPAAPDATALGLLGPLLNGGPLVLHPPGHLRARTAAPRLRGTVRPRNGV
jgi:non-ribosomal peptide synthetase component F